MFQLPLISMPENGAPVVFTRQSTVRQLSNTSGGLEGVPQRSSLVRQQSRSSITSLGNSNSGRNSVIGQFGRRRSIIRKPRTSYWTKLTDEENQKKLKRVRLHRSIKCSDKTKAGPLFTHFVLEHCNSPIDYS